jgi:hypothetical protein
VVIAQFHFFQLFLASNTKKLSNVKTPLKLGTAEIFAYYVNTFSGPLCNQGCLENTALLQFAIQTTEWVAAKHG